jgi:polyadenylate-binding protein
MADELKKVSVHITEIPQNLEKQDVIGKLKDKLGLEQTVPITSGNYMNAKNEIPYMWGVFKFPDEETKNRCLQECRFIVLDDESQIKSRVQVNDRNFVKEQIANGAKNICVKKLPAGWDHDDLLDYFQKYGKIASCKVSKTFKVTTEFEGDKQVPKTTADSNRYGYVSFENEADAMAALEDNKPKGKEDMCAEPFTKEKKSPVPNNLFVKNFPLDWTDSELAAKFSKYCSKKEDGSTNGIVSAKIMRDDKQTSQGYGFVCFEKAEDAQKAKDSLDGQKVEKMEEPLYVAFALKKEVREKALRKSMLRQNLYVKNLPESVGEKEMKEFFEQFGKVKNTKIMVAQNGVD